jgi:disulfide bond formation protein DsbB
VTHGTTIALAALGVLGQVLVALVLLAFLAAAVGVEGPVRVLRSTLWGYELWAAFLVAAVATGGSLFFSEIAGYVPCELCWYQRTCMYPLSLLTLLAAARHDHPIARYLLPLPIVGAGVSVHHLLIENAVIREPSACRVGGAGCAVKWINEFGYVTIPTLALTAFALLIVFLAFAATGMQEDAATLEEDE